MSQIIKFFSLLLIGIFFPMSSFAAGLDLVSISTKPETPGPNQEVTVTIKSFAVDLNTAEIVWYVNKEPMQHGVALKTLSLHTGDFGEQTVVDIAIIPTYGEPLNKQIVIEPSEVDILWEAQTYTPPFYKGKALPSFKSLVKVTAMPRRNSYASDPTPFYYKWTFNRIQGAGEALGMNSVLIPAGWPDSSVPVSVAVSIPNSPWKGGENVTIPANKTKVVLYEQDPLLGTLFNNALRVSATRNANLLSVRAVPYFFSLDNYLNHDLLYTWTVNGSIAPNQLEPTTMSLAKSGKGAESFSVILRVQNPKKILQEGQTITNITFPQEQ